MRRNSLRRRIRSRNTPRQSTTQRKRTKTLGNMGIRKPRKNDVPSKTRKPTKSPTHLQTMGRNSHPNWKSNQTKNNQSILQKQKNPRNGHEILHRRTRIRHLPATIQSTKNHRQKRAIILYNGRISWKLDVERCARFFLSNPNGTGCNTCVKVCPWTRPRTWNHNLVRRLVDRSRLARKLAIKADWLLKGHRRGHEDKKWWFDKALNETIHNDHHPSV